MARQQVIPGTEREDHPDVEELCLAFEDADAEWGEAGKRREQKRLEVEALLKVRKLLAYKYYSKRGQRYRVARLEDQDPKLKFSNTDEGNDEVGEGVADPGAPPAGMQGLITEAEKAQADANVTETADGDVDVPDKAAPKKPRSKSKAKKAKRK